MRLVRQSKNLGGAKVNNFFRRAGSVQRILFFLL